MEYKIVSKENIDTFEIVNGMITKGIIKPEDLPTILIELLLL